jgi:type VI secretion system protein ImpL
MKWVKLALVILGFSAFSATVFFAGPLIGFGEARPFDPLWVRLLIIGILLLILLVWAFVKFLRRRKGQAAIEKALVVDAPPTGDGERACQPDDSGAGDLEEIWQLQDLSL